MLSQLIFLSVCIVAHTAADFSDLPRDDYTPERLRHDREELRKRIECFMDRGPCTHVSAVYKRHAQDMVLTSCSNCSPELRSMAQAFLNGVREKYPGAYRELILKYDNKYESAAGVIKNVLSSLPSLPSGASLQAVPSDPSVPPIFVFFFSCNIICNDGASNCINAKIDNCPSRN